MAGRIDRERVKTYLFGVAIGCVVVAMVMLLKADMARRQLAKAEAEARAAEAKHVSRPDADSAPR